MLSACIKTHSCSGFSTECVVGKHTLDSKLHSLFGLLAHELAVLYFLETADVSGVMTVILRLELLARENRLGCVDDDDKLTAVNMRGELGAMLTAKNGRCLDGSLVRDNGLEDAF